MKGQISFGRSGLFLCPNQKNVKFFIFFLRISKLMIYLQSMFNPKKISQRKANYMKDSYSRYIARKKLRRKPRDGEKLGYKVSEGT